MTPWRKFLNIVLAPWSSILYSSSLARNINWTICQLPASPKNCRVHRPTEVFRLTHAWISRYSAVTKTSDLSLIPHAQPMYVRSDLTRGVLNLLLPLKCKWDIGAYSSRSPICMISRFEWLFENITQCELCLTSCFVGVIVMTWGYDVMLWWGGWGKQEVGRWGIRGEAEMSWWANEREVWSWDGSAAWSFVFGWWCKYRGLSSACLKHGMGNLA
jgi:hypothetical protein